MEAAASNDAFAAIDADEYLALNSEFAARVVSGRCKALFQIHQRLRRLKPPAPTVLRRCTARNLHYLQQKNLTAPFATFAWYVPVSSRKPLYPGGPLIQDYTPSHGV